MKAVKFINNQLMLSYDSPEPSLLKNWVKIKVQKAGICSTDLEIIKGYMGFSGILGHEFIGKINESPDNSLIGKRVTAEINFSCNECSFCKNKLQRHCLTRSVLGTYKADGAMAEFCTVPISNIVEIPSEISDSKAVFIEPLAAACEILEQIQCSGDEKVCVIGDGKLGILCSWVLSTKFKNIMLLGHNESKLSIASWNNVETSKNIHSSHFDIVVEATGSADGLKEAISICKPRGKIILKSTIADNRNLNLTPIVVNEIVLLGSRCGQFKDAINILLNYPTMPIEKIISADFFIDDAILAFKKSQEKGILKVILNF